MTRRVPDAFRRLSGLVLLALAACGGGDSATAPTGGGTLVIEDLVVGTGATAAAGDVVNVHYVGTLTSGTKFDSSYDRGAPYTFQIGAGTTGPPFRLSLEERVAATVPGGAHRVHVDDHLGTSGALFLGACVCDRCVEGFRPRDPDYRATVLAWLKGAPAGETRRVQDHQDWAFVKERGGPGLVRGWIAASYAAGHCLMAPHRQWCYTEEKGTHWYDGPREAYAPLYRFVRENRALLDGYEAWADVGLVMPHRSFAADRESWIGIGEALAAAGVPYRVVIGGDEVVDREIDPRDISALRVLLVPAEDELRPTDRAVIAGNPGEDRLGQVRPVGIPVHLAPRGLADGGLRRAGASTIASKRAGESEPVAPVRGGALDGHAGPRRGAGGGRGGCGRPGRS